MYAEERQQEIVRRARAEGRVDVVALAESFGVTAETIRRDLTVLERAAVLRRVHGGAIILDAGSTTARLAQLLPADRELTVVVNSPVLAGTLGLKPNLTVLLLGGRVRGKTMATVDDWALRPLAEMYVDVAFMGTNGCTVERGMTTPDPAEAAVKRAMITAARRVVLLADHTKIGNDYLARFGGLADLDLLITDNGLDGELAAEVEVAGVRVVRA